MAHPPAEQDLSCLGVVWRGHPLFCHLLWLSASTTQSSELLWHQLRNQNKSQVHQAEVKEEAAHQYWCWQRSPFRVRVNSQKRKKRRVLKNILAAGLWCKEIILCVCVSIHLSKRGGKSFQKLISQSSMGVREAQAGRPERGLRGSIFLSLVPVWVEEEERKAPPPLFLRRLKRKPKCGICVFHKNSKSSRSYCFHGKNVIRGSEKAHVGLGTSAAQNCLENNWAAAWQNKNAAVHAGGLPGNRGAE